LEVAGPGGGKQGEFLHLLEVGEPVDSNMSPAQLVGNARHSGVSLDAAGTRVIIRFARQGPLAASVQIGDGPQEMLGSNKEGTPEP
jgi:hypothetical protein